MQTLKQRYETRAKLDMLAEKCLNMDASLNAALIAEAREIKLISEAINDETINRVIHVAQKLRQVDVSKFPSLQQMVSTSLEALNKAMASGKNVKDKKWFGLKKTDIGKAIHLVGQLQTSFEQVGKVIQANAKDVKAVADKTVGEVLNSPEAANALTQVFAKSLGGKAPSGLAAEVARATVRDVAKTVKELRNTGAAGALQDIAHAADAAQPEQPAAPADASSGSKPGTTPAAASPTPEPGPAAAPVAAPMAPSEPAKPTTGDDDADVKEKLGDKYPIYKKMADQAGLNVKQFAKAIAVYNRSRRAAPKTKPAAPPEMAAAA
jgi:hypothetical protein